MNTINNRASLTKRRSLRKRQTPEEEILWEYLRKNRSGFKWRRQVSIGYYIADFYCHELKCVIELDGIQHSENDHKEYDRLRDEFFAMRNILTIRITNKEIREASTLSTIVERVTREASRVRTKQ